MRKVSRMNPMRLWLPSLLASLPILAALPQAAVNLPVHKRFRKIEAMIPMRDGVRLHTAIYVPRQPTGLFPFLLHRSPYGSHPYGPEAFPSLLGPSSALSLEEYAFVYQDVRGRYLSEGHFVEVRPPGGPADETTDTYDTLQWLLMNIPGHNGRVGMWGISYPGHYVAQGMLCGHPALKAVSPQAPMVDLWQGDDTYHHGAFQLAATAAFYCFFRAREATPTLDDGPLVPQPAKDGYRWFLERGNAQAAGEALGLDQTLYWTLALAHPARDAFWQARDLRPRIRDVRPAVLTVGGWFDGEDLFGALATHRTLATQSPATSAHLVMGPWTHGAWAGPDASRLGMLSFGENTAQRFQREMEYPFFQFHLKGTPAPPLPRVQAFETGTNRWRKFDSWPPKTAQPATFHFGPRGSLDTQPPAPAAPPDQFQSDPAKPVPYTQAVSFGYHAAYMVEDQRFAGSRPDVMTYETHPLKEDLTLVGPVKAVLHVSTTGTDSDWVVKVVDVLPEGSATPSWGPPGWQASGAQMLVRAEVFRGRYHRAFDKPEPFIPGQSREITFTLPDLFHTFKKGHRLMVQVQCSWFPLVDRNPQTFVDIATAPPEAYVKASQHIFRDQEKASRIECLVLTGKPSAH